MDGEDSEKNLQSDEPVEEVEVEPQYRSFKKLQLQNPNR
jgi:hypothetical protein